MGKKLEAKGDLLIRSYIPFRIIMVWQYTNKNNLEGMINDVIAGLYHISSSQENLQHQFCPKGKDYWCGWQREIANGDDKYEPKKGLSVAIVEVVLPIYKDLSNPVLLTRCLYSYKQNPSESLNYMVWRRCHKKMYLGKKVVELCSASAVSSFNDGSRSIASLLEKSGIVVGSNTRIGLQFADKKDQQLLRKSPQRSQSCREKS